WIAPRGARFAWQQWIVPKAHQHDLGAPDDLASLMQDSVRAMRRVSEAFNWVFVTFPHEERGHWYLELFPRTAMIAGFELGCGVFVNTMTSDETARVFASFML
ncbi:MAG TPA: hypothetical protein VNN08_14160, partial [Thermoanaerobaculia bacterium]|nr:hypothetical protein [Thermoanaerobaculia bacterium]